MASILNKVKERYDDRCSISAAPALCESFVESFPELQNEIDSEIESFCEDSRTKQTGITGDVGEFLVMLALSSHGINSCDVINLVLKHHLAEQSSKVVEERSKLWH